MLKLERSYYPKLQESVNQKEFGFQRLIYYEFSITFDYCFKNYFIHKPNNINNNTNPNSWDAQLYIVIRTKKVGRNLKMSAPFVPFIQIAKFKKLFKAEIAISNILKEFLQF